MEGPYSGTVSVASSDFTITLDQLAPASGVTCSITDSASTSDTITSTPVVIAEGESTGTFTITPGTTGPRTIRLDSATVISTSQSLDVTDQQISYNSVAAGVVTSYRISFPFPSVGNINVASNNFTAILGDGSLGTGVSVEITPASNGGGSFDPISVTLSDSTPSATFTYTPETSDAGSARSISATNLLSTSEMLDDPLPDTYTVNPIPTCTGYTFTGPITAPIGEQSGLFIITPTGTPTLQSDGTYSTEAIFTGTIRITDSRDSSHIDYPFSSSSAPQSFTVTASGTAGTSFTLTPSCISGGLSSPAALTVVAQTYAELDDTITKPYSLAASNTYYRLTSDITADSMAFTIDNDHITLDLNGFTILYDNATPVDVLNGGFEDGDFTSWDMSGIDESVTAQVIPAMRGFWGNYAAEISGYNPYIAVPTQTLKSATIAITDDNIPYIAMAQPSQDPAHGTIQLGIYDSITNSVIAQGTQEGSGTKWEPHSGGAVSMQFTPLTTNPVYIKIILDPSDPGAISAVPWVILDGDINGSQLTSGYVNETVRPSGVTINGHSFTSIALAVEPTTTSLTLKLVGGISDSNHYIYADAALIEGPGSYSNVVDNSDSNFGSVDNATTWTLSTYYERYGANYCWLAGGGTGTQYCYWTFTGLTANASYNIYLTWPTADTAAINFDSVSVRRYGSAASGINLIHGILSSYRSNICITSSAPSTGSGAIAGAITINSSGTITDITVGNGGSGYTIPPLVFIANGAEDSKGIGAKATATINESTGQVTGFTVVDGGVGYASAVVYLISGGAIIQGQSNSYFAGPIYFYYMSDTQVDNISMYANGADCDLVYMAYCTNMCILNTHMVSGVDLLTNRMAARAFVYDYNTPELTGTAGTRRFEYNLLEGQHQGGFNTGLQVDGVIARHNRIYHNSIWTDGYAFGCSMWTNFEIAYNTAIALKGRGILFEGHPGQDMQTGSVHDNFIDVQEQGNLDFNASELVVAGFRLRNYDAYFTDFTVSNNIICAHTGKPGQTMGAAAIRFMLRNNYGVYQDSGVVIENNLFKAIVSDYDSTLAWQNAMAIDVAGFPPGLGMVFRNNICESNCTSLSTGDNDSDGWTTMADGQYDISFTSNTLKKSSDGISVVRCGNDRMTRSHKSVLVGAFGLLNDNIRLINTQYSNGAAVVGANPDGFEMIGDTGNNLSTGWLCNVTVYQHDGISAANGAIVTVTDANSNTKDYTADINGVVTGIEILTTTYTLGQYLTTGDPAYQVPPYRNAASNNPFTFTATWESKSATPVEYEFTSNHNISLVMTT